MDDYAGTPNIAKVVFASVVQLVDNRLGQTIYAGVVTDPTLVVTGPNRNEWVLQCTDFTFYADNALTRGVFNGASVDYIVKQLTATADCGITAGEYVGPGPQLGMVSMGWRTLSDAWRTLAQLAGSVIPYGWYVDENLQLHFFDTTRATPTGVTFTTSPTTAGSATEGHIALDSSFQYEWDGTSLDNQILVQGANQTVTIDDFGPPTDVFYSDGVTTAWPMRFTLSGAAPDKLTVNGVPEVVGASGSGATFEVSKNAIGQWFLTTASAPPAGSEIDLWYSYQFPVIVRVNDYASQEAYEGPNGGVFAKFISDSSLTTAPMALARAQRDRTEYAYPVERITFTTTEEWVGWIRAGNLCTIDCQFVPDSKRGWARGVTDTFCVIQNQVTFGRGGYRTMQITAVRV